MRLELTYDIDTNLPFVYRATCQVNTGLHQFAAVSLLDKKLADGTHGRRLTFCELHSLLHAIERKLIDEEEASDKLNAN